jgi:uncharacterized membrane protein
MLGLPPDVQAKTLGYYEQRFVDGVNAGRSEQDVARELDDPKKDRDDAARQQLQRPWAARSARKPPPPAGRLRRKAQSGQVLRMGWCRAPAWRSSTCS